MKKGESLASPVGTALKLAIPAIVESFFVAFTGLIDSFMVSSLGSNAVAAVGLTTQPKFVGLAVFFAINVALSALTARRLGEKKKKEANEILLTAFCMVAFLVLVVSVLMCVYAPQILSFCGSTVQTHDTAVLYFRIIISCIVFNCIQMAINSAQRGAGNTKITMRTNITSSVVNIIFNYLLIGGKCGFPAWGIAGAAIATVLGAFVAAVMSIISIFNTKVFVNIPYIVKNRLRPTLTAFKNILNMSYSVFFEQLLMRIGFMLTAIMAAKQGNGAMAAHQVGMNIMGLTFSFGDGLQAASVALIGRSLGENLPDKAKEYGAACMRIGTVISLVLAAIYFFGARVLMGLFFEEEEIVNIGVSIMRVIIFVVLFQIRQVIYTGSLRGAGDTLYTAVSAAVSVTVVRTAVSYFCGYTLGWGITGIWIGILGDQVARFIMASIRFKAGNWVKIKI